MTRQHILKAAVAMWGVNSQVMMAIEEMAELTQALSKVYRASGDQKEKAVVNVQEELADVRIMMDQLMLIFDTNQTCSVSEIENAKLAHLEYRISHIMNASNKAPGDN